MACESASTPFPFFAGPTAMQLYTFQMPSVGGPAALGITWPALPQALVVEGIYGVVSPLSQLWQITSAGQIASATNANIGLTVGTDGSVGIGTLQPGNAAQTWSISGGWIINTQTQLALTVAMDQGSNGHYPLVVMLAGNGQPQQWTLSGLDCNGLVTTILNATPNDLTLTYPGGEAQYPLPAGASISVPGYYSGGLAVSVQIWDASYSTSVASFVAHQHHCLASAGQVWIDTINYIDGYSLTNVTTEEGSGSQNLPGNASITVEYTP